jgi:hypothetical protein
MAAKLCPILQEAQFDTTTGEFLAGGKIAWYLDSTSTSQAVYTDSAGTIPHTNPIILNARGEPPSQIWLTDGVTYKAILMTPADVVITTYTGISGITGSGAAISEWIDSGLTPTYATTRSFTVNGNQTLILQPGRRLKLTNTGGVVYATIRSSTYVAPNTTLVIYTDDGVLDVGLSEFSYGSFSATNPAVPGNLSAISGNVFNDNVLRNSDFDIWQTDNFAVSGTNYVADLWKVLTFGSDHSSSRVAATLGSTDIAGDTAPKYYLQMLVTEVAGAGNFVKLNQPIESVLTLAGSKAVLTFWGKVASGTENVSVEFLQSFGTGGAPSAAVTTIGVTKVQLTTTFQKFVIPVTIPSIAGKTLGTDNNDYLMMSLWLDAGSTFDSRTDTLGHQSGLFTFSRFRLESGWIPGEYKKVDFGDELSYCTRFFRKSFPYNTEPATGAGVDGCVQGIVSQAGASTNFFSDTRFDPPMRAVPTIILYNPVNLNNQAHNSTDAVDCSGTSSAGTTSGSFKWSCTTNAGAGVGETIIVHYTADARLL